MSTKAYNQWVARNSEKIFANTSSFNAETEMAGREDAFQALGEVVRGNAARLVMISELLGAGKTFFLNKALTKFTEHGLLNETRESATLLLDDILREPDFDLDDVKFLVVEELDRKSDWQSLSDGLEALAVWHEKHPAATLVVTGDFALLNEVLTAPLRGTSGPANRIRFESLDFSLLIRAIELRIRHQLGAEGLSTNEAAQEASEAAQAMVEPEVQKALLPSTDPAVANFRDVLVILNEMSKFLPANKQDCRFTREVYLKMEAKSRRRVRSGLQKVFVDQMFRTIRERAANDTYWAPAYPNEWPWMRDFSAAQVKEICEDIVPAVLRQGLLLPMGIPYEQGDDHDAPGPYLPSVEAFAEALLGGTL